ncbi:MAG: hypothetical protein Q7T81_03585 [Pseudolabrys sp.]|nr:hypothetical protein [Pseudolabrys sp.]
MRDMMNRTRTALAVALASAMLAGCSSSDSAGDRVGSSLVSPGKFEFYTCAHLAQQVASYKQRERELEALIAKANSGFVSAIAYRPEYLQTRGNLVELGKEGARKNCPPVIVESPKPPAAPAPKRR